MSIISKMRKQTCVYWGPSKDDGMGGFTWPVPVEMSCRWEDVDGSVNDPRTHDVMNDSTVYVESDVVVNGYLYLGELDDLSTAEKADPTIVENARQIKGFSKLPDLRNRETLRTVAV